MSGGIKKIDYIKSMAVFHDFQWQRSVINGGGSVDQFKNINVIYGRNYSGKTTLSRIFRAMETGVISDKYSSPEFHLSFDGGIKTTQNTLKEHGRVIRVFNEDFVRDNLQFIMNPEDNIEPFAILGEDNNKIEKEIEELEGEVGSNDEGKETGLYANRIKANADFYEVSKKHKKATDDLKKQLGDKATDRKIGIKYKPVRFGDQNYNIQKLKTDIGKVLDAKYQPLSDEELTQCEKLISEKALQPIPSFHAHSLNVSTLAKETEALVTKKISESDKIEELVKDAILNRWVNDGRSYHKGMHDNCAFCGNPISEQRWSELEKHFDKESEQLEKDIVSLIDRIEVEKSTAISALSIDKNHFYSKFHERIDELDKVLSHTVGKYTKLLDALIEQLNTRKDDILNPKSYKKHDDVSSDLIAVWNSYDEVRSESDTFSGLLSAEQTKARESLRLKEISDYLVTIRYQEQLSAIDALKCKVDEVEQRKNCIEGDIRHKEIQITAKKRELNDEEKGAKKVNEYLNNFFGHQFLTLEAKKSEVADGESKRIRFEVIRGGKKAYHLSEGECSLLAFCYFLAKLHDIDTKDSKPIIWIDDPVSSLDGNHIFFVYSLLSSEVVSDGIFEQLFVSTHNLDFLKYLKRLSGKFIDSDGRQKDYQKSYFLVTRKDKTSTIGVMPRYLKEYVTEFNYLFHQIYRCAVIDSIDDTNYTTFYNFGNNARKFFEVYLYYKYPDQGMSQETLRLFFGEENIPAILTDRINNEYSHLCGVFERGATPVEVPEMQTAAQQIIERLKKDYEQYSSLLKSVGVNEEDLDDKPVEVE